MTMQSFCIMKECPLCKKAKFHRINFLFSSSICNECYLIASEITNCNRELPDPVPHDTY